MPTKSKIVKEFANPLVLVSPKIEAQKVKDAQYLMAGHNRFEGLATYKDGDIDGVYGTLSAQATRRTKFWLGYPNNSINESFGQTLYEYLRLEHWRPLPDTYRKRREDRLAAASETPGMKALEYAVQFLGYKEDPFGSNQTKFGRDYGFNGVAWCAIFESYCFKYTGFKSFHYAACERIHHDAMYGINKLMIVRTPRPGDLNIFNIHGDPYAHTSFFDTWLDQASGAFQDLGGNTGPIDVSNGGEVLRQKRYRSNVSFFVRAG